MWILDGFVHWIIFFCEIAGVKRDAEDGVTDASMSSDDTDFNPDNLEALSAREEYDSEPSSTSDDTDGEEVGFFNLTESLI